SADPDDTVESPGDSDSRLLPTHRSSSSPFSPLIPRKLALSPYIPSALQHSAN
ncbi:hypothetical protein P7K49_033955, partial [Saguinus oedipus]